MELPIAVSTLDVRGVPTYYNSASVYTSIYKYNLWIL